MTTPPLGSNESKRLHLDWWGRCRTCRYWNGADRIIERKGHPDGPYLDYRWEDAKCENPRSPLYGQETWTEGHCDQWDSFDIDVALLEGEDAYDEETKSTQMKNRQARCTLTAEDCKKGCSNGH